MEHFTVIIPDLPGHGGSDAITGPFRYRATARIMFTLLDRVNVTQVYGLGHSAGAITLLHMAAAAPERIAAMVAAGIFPAVVREFLIDRYPK